MPEQPLDPSAGSRMFSDSAVEIFHDEAVEIDRFEKIAFYEFYAVVFGKIEQMVFHDDGSCKIEFVTTLRDVLMKVRVSEFLFAFVYRLLDYLIVFHYLKPKFNHYLLSVVSVFSAVFAGDEKESPKGGS